VRRTVLLALLLLPLVSGCGGHATSSDSVSRWIKVEQLPKAAIPGAELFESKGCTVCHTYAGSGHSTLNAPDLTTIGSRHLGIAFQIAHLKCPACVNPGSPMPPSRSLGPVRLHQLAVFLEASRGTH
jgi:Cytochrome c